MSEFFISVYRFFRKHMVLFYGILVTCLVVMGFFASRIRLEENVYSFFPDNGDSGLTAEVFNNLTVMDKIIVMFSAADGGSAPADSLIAAAGYFRDYLLEEDGGNLVREVMSGVDNGMVIRSGDFVYDNLPVFLDSVSFAGLDSVLVPEAVEETMAGNRNTLLSPSGFVLKDYIVRDPLHLASGVMSRLQDAQGKSEWKIIKGHIFSEDASTLLLFITPVYGTGSTGKNDALVDIIEAGLGHTEEHYSGVSADYFGGPSVGVYNARQIKKDTMLTSLVAILVIVAFIAMCFKKKRSVLLILAPVLFGALFSLSLIFFIKGTISAIAVGAGSAVLGIALSYSIHVIAHQNHVFSVEQLIREIAYPLTIGSFTTIGAFIGLLFTSSGLLRDFGLFASFALIGTTVFCLVFLPHFLDGSADKRESRVLSAIERFNSRRFEKNRWLLAFILILTVVCLFTSRKVGFDDDMMSINYEPEHLLLAERKLESLFNEENSTVMFVSTGRTMDEAIDRYRHTEAVLDGFVADSLVESYSSISTFLVKKSEQEERIGRWKSYWSEDRLEGLGDMLSSGRQGFRPGTFDGFLTWAGRDFSPVDYSSATMPLLDEFITFTPDRVMIISNVTIREENKQEVYDAFEDEDGVVVFDRGYFMGKWVSAVGDDFNRILFISSFLVFFALWISYGRIELALLSFLPMLVSWVIIVGIMGLAGIQFNIINIILSTFIFGIGDDFSIFIMDGLVSRYKTGKEVLNSHKTAIFFSAFTIVVGIGVLVFARHPALKSLSLISIFGMAAVVLVAFTLQPVIFDLFITGPVSKGCPPYTISGILRSVFLFGSFFIGCILIGVISLLLFPLPLGKKRKRAFICRLMHLSCRLIVFMAFSLKKERINEPDEDFSKPGIVISNHQSFLDIIILLSMTPKLVMVTKEWVWNSPVFGHIVRYAGFVCIRDGYGNNEEELRQRLEDGYTVAVFPEGTRSPDGRIHRFHKGAFLLAERLGTDLIPVLFYGNGTVMPKSDPFYVRKGLIAYKILPRIRPADASFGPTFRERTGNICAYMRREYAALREEKDNIRNPYFRWSLISKYIYKGPVTEWYVRIKLLMENYYEAFDKLIPVNASVTDIGCGMGMMDLMLASVSPYRKFTGIDYDEEKIAIASSIAVSEPRVAFRLGDARTCELEESDVFVMGDMLHYMDYRDQELLIKRCSAKLLPGGKIIIRDGDSCSESRRHRLTRFTEWLSIKVFRFNKKDGEIYFTSQGRLSRIAEENGLRISSVENDPYTSNTIYILKGHEQV